MGIEKVGLNSILHTVAPKPKNESAKYINIDERRRDYFAATAKINKINTDQKIKAESIRVSDVNKINARGYRSPAPNVPSTYSANRENILYYESRRGLYLDTYA